VKASTCILLLVLYVPLHVGMAADMPLKVQRALTLIGTVELPRMMFELCKARAPDSAAKNSESYDAWRQKFGDLSASAWHLLEERNEVLAPMLSDFTEGNVKSVHEAASFSFGMLSSNADARGATYIQEMCTKYPEFLGTLQEGYEPKVLSQIEALKAAFP
jgi:hypothetical protein